MSAPADPTGSATAEPAGSAATSVEPFGIRRLLLVATGSRSVHTLPAWIDWLRDAQPALLVHVVLTRTAERFVAPAALRGRTGSVSRDEWPDEGWPARHVEWADWAEAIVVYPATLHFVARLALGLADSPALLAAQCTAAPVAVAPALPPGGLVGPAYRMHREALERRPNVVVVHPVPVTSATTGRADGSGAAPLPVVLAAADALRRALPAPEGEP